MFSLIKPNSIIITTATGQQYTVASDHPRWDDIKEAVKAKDYKAAVSMIDLASHINAAGNGKVVVRQGVVWYGNTSVNNYLTSRILDMLREGFDINPMCNFMENLMQNPSKRAVDSLYHFLEVGNMPITEDGCFVTYKRVRDDYTDVRTGTFSNRVGSVVEMPRNQVDEDPDQTCSYGLHVCSAEYLNHFSGARIVLCKVNPRDVVAIPRDYNDTKMRVCRYEVIGEIEDNKDDIDGVRAKSVWSDDEEEVDYYDVD